MGKNSLAVSAHPRNSGSPRRGRLQQKAPSGPTRKNRMVPKGERVKTKVSIAIAPDELEWATAEAKRLGISVSAVFAAALHAAQQSEAWQRAFEAMGHTEPLTQAEIEQADAELREMGLIP